MPRVKTGEIMQNFQLQTPFRKQMMLKEAVGEQRTAIIFLRYYGCTLCQYDMKLLKDHYQEITEQGGSFMVVLQSTPENISKNIQQDSFPYTIICDPDKTIYKALEITPAQTKEELVGGNTMEKISKARESFSHGDYEGEELQLPAVMVVDKNLRVLYIHYGVDAADVPNYDELRVLLNDTREGAL